jgi:DNA-directed RNA polymerase specialized sigma24 family protein
MSTETRTEYYTPEELAAKCAVSLETVKNRMYRQKLPGQTKIFGQWRFRRDLIDLALLRGEL